MIDTHCHLYSEEFAADIDQVIERAQNSGVQNFYLPAIDSSTHDGMMALALKYSGTCLPMIGLHPCHVKEDFEKEIDMVKAYLSKEKFWAIGETGLDFHWDTQYVVQQYESLHIHAALALEYKLPLVLHTRAAMQETIDVVKEYASSGLTGIFHCFGGSLQEANQITALGFKLGIGGVVTYKKAGLAEVLADVDLRDIVLETDAPYLSPVPFRGKRNESSYMIHIAQKLAEVKNITVEEVQEITSNNARTIFKNPAK